MSRPDWDDYFFQIAALVASRATCPRASIGAVLVKNRRVIGTGYNGVAEGLPHCEDTPEHRALDHCRATIHAEYNALANALVPAFGATLYVVGTRRVCPDCADRLRENGVTNIRWRSSAPTLDGVLGEVVQWGRQTFPASTDATKTLHLIEEVQELHEAPDDPMEMADVVMILAHLAAAKGVNLAEAVAAKLAICRTRTWAPPDERGVIKAVKAGAP